MRSRRHRVDLTLAEEADIAVAGDAADHAELCDHVVIAMATHRLTEAGGQLDLRYAELLSQGQRRAAMASYAEVFAPRGPVRPVMQAFLWLLAPSLLGPCDETFRRDVLVEAQAELGHEGESCFDRIQVPVLVAIGGLSSLLCCF